jgi:hypothetical protein
MLLQQLEQLLCGVICQHSLLQANVLLMLLRNAEWCGCAASGVAHGTRDASTAMLKDQSSTALLLWYSQASLQHRPPTGKERTRSSPFVRASGERHSKKGNVPYASNCVAQRWRIDRSQTRYIDVDQLDTTKRAPGSWGCGAATNPTRWRYRGVNR